MLLIIRLAKLSSVLYNSLIVSRAVALLFLVILVIEIRLDRFYIEIKINRLLII